MLNDEEDFDNMIEVLHRSVSLNCAMLTGEGVCLRACNTTHFDMEDSGTCQLHLGGMSDEIPYAILNLITHTLGHIL